MMQKRWFKAFVWFVSSTMFFMAACILISEFSPDPSEQQVVAYMAGMMDSMENSLMGLSMTIEQDTELKRWISNSTSLTIILVIISLVGGDYIRFKRRKNNG